MLTGSAKAAPGATRINAARKRNSAAVPNLRMRLKRTTGCHYHNVDPARQYGPPIRCQPGQLDVARAAVAVAEDFFGIASALDRIGDRYSACQRELPVRGVGCRVEIILLRIAGDTDGVLDTAEHAAKLEQ